MSNDNHNNENSIVRGSFWQRVLASIIDNSLFFYIPLFLLYVYARDLFNILVTSPEFLPEKIKFLYYIWIYYGLTALASIFFYHRYSATPGKLFMGLKLVDESSGKPTLSRIILREFIAKIITNYSFFIGHLICLLKKDKKCLHDILVETNVIQLPATTKIHHSSEKLSRKRVSLIFLAIIVITFFHYDISRRLNDTSAIATKHYHIEEAYYETTKRKTPEVNEKKIKTNSFLDRYQKATSSHTLEKILENAQFDLKNLEQEYINNYLMQNLIIVKHPNVMKTFHPRMDISYEFLEDFFNFYMKGEVYFNKEALKDKKIQKLIKKISSKNTDEDMASEFIKRIEYLRPQIQSYNRSKIEVNPLLINNRVFLDYLFAQDCNLRDGIETSVNVDLADSIDKYIISLLLSVTLSDRNRWRCMPEIFKKNQKIIREISRIDPVIIFEIIEEGEGQVIQDDPETYQNFLKYAIKQELDRTERESYRYFLAGANYNPNLRFLFESQEYQTSIFGVHPEMLKGYPISFKFHDKFINSFFEKYYRPMRFFNLAHHQYKELEEIYAKKKIDHKKIKQSTIDSVLSILKEAHCCGTKEILKIRKVFVLIDEELYNDPDFYSPAIEMLNSPHHLFHYTPKNYDFSNEFKEWILKQKHNPNNHKLFSLKATSLPHKLQNDPEFVKRFDKYEN